jgi:hypothetical protein
MKSPEQTPEMPAMQRFQNARCRPQRFAMIRPAFIKPKLLTAIRPAIIAVQFARKLRLKALDASTSLSIRMLIKQRTGETVG